MTLPAPVVGCGRPDCCARRSDYAASTVEASESTIIAGYGIPLVGLLAFAAAAEALVANAVAVLLAGLLGLVLGARQAGRLSAKGSAPN